MPPTSSSRGYATTSMQTRARTPANRLACSTASTRPSRVGEGSGRSIHKRLPGVKKLYRTATAKNRKRLRRISDHNRFRESHAAQAFAVSTTASSAAPDKRCTVTTPTTKAISPAPAPSFRKLNLSDYDKRASIASAASFCALVPSCMTSSSNSLAPSKSRISS